MRTDRRSGIGRSDRDSSVQGSSMELRVWEYTGSPDKPLHSACAHREGIGPGCRIAPTVNPAGARRAEQRAILTNPRGSVHPIWKLAEIIRCPLPDDDGREDGVAVEQQVAHTSRAVHLRIGGSRRIFHRKWSRATLQLYWFRFHRSVNPAVDLFRDGVLHRCGDSHHSPITDSFESESHQVE